MGAIHHECCAAENRGKTAMISPDSRSRQETGRNNLCEIYNPNGIGRMPRNRAIGLRPCLAGRCTGMAFGIYLRPSGRLERRSIRAATKWGGNP
jgi:hypothetical protein